MAEAIKPCIICEEGWCSGREDRWTAAISVLGWLLPRRHEPACRFSRGSPTLLAFGEEGSRRSGQEAVLRCGKATPAVGFAIIKCELGQSKALSFLPSSSPVCLDGEMVGKKRSRESSIP